MADNLNVEHIPQFDIAGDVTSLAPRWQRWKRAFEFYLVSKGVSEDIQKRALLLHSAGMAVQDIFETLEDPGVTGTDTAGEYEKAMRTLDAHFKPQMNVPYERHVFRQMRQNDTETTDQFVARLARQAANCDFGTTQKDQIRDQLIDKCSSSELRRKLLGKGTSLNLKTAQEIARAMEAVNIQFRQMEKSNSGSSQNPETGHVSSIRAKQNDNKLQQTNRNANIRQNKNRQGSCYRCGRDGHYAKDKECPARNKECGKCGFLGHFAAVCKTKNFALPKPTLMKADKFLSREEARERRHKVLEEKQIRSQNNAQAISAQAMVDQERLSTSTRRSVRSFASNSTATPLRATEPSTEGFTVSERVPEKGPGGTKNIQITSDKEISHQAPEVIVEESKSVISSEDKEGKLVLVARDKELVETDKVGEDKGGGQSANITLSKEKEIKEGINSELGSKVKEREVEEGRSVEIRTMANLNTSDSESLESEKQSVEPRSEIIESEDNRTVDAGDTVEDNSEVKTNSMAETDKQGIGQRSNETEGEVSENQAAPGHQDVDEGTIMDNDIGERIEVKGQQREGVQEETWDGSDEGVADLDDVEEEMENGVHGGAN